MSEFINAKPGAVEATAQRQEPFTIDRVYVGAVSKDNRGTDLYYKVLYPNGSTSRHMTSVHAVLRDLLFMEQLNKDLRAALHKAGDELGEARRETAQAKANFANDQQASAEIIRTVRARIEELERRNANQAAMIQEHLNHDSGVFSELEETRAALARTAQRAAEAEQREAALREELDEIEADEAKGDAIIVKCGGPEFNDVDTYSELATEAVRLADEVQDLRKTLAGRTLTPTGEVFERAHRLALHLGSAYIRVSVIHDETTYEVLGEGEVRGFYAAGRQWGKLELDGAALKHLLEVARRDGKATGLFIGAGGDVVARFEKQALTDVQNDWMRYAVDVARISEHAGDAASYTLGAPKFRNWVRPYRFGPVAFCEQAMTATKTFVKFVPESLLDAMREERDDARAELNKTTARLAMADMERKMLQQTLNLERQMSSAVNRLMGR